MSPKDMVLFYKILKNHHGCVAFCKLINGFSWQLLSFYTIQNLVKRQNQKCYSKVMIEHLDLKAGPYIWATSAPSPRQTMKPGLGSRRRPPLWEVMTTDALSVYPLAGTLTRAPVLNFQLHVTVSLSQMRRPRLTTWKGTLYEVESSGSTGIPALVSTQQHCSFQDHSTVCSDLDWF